MNIVQGEHKRVVFNLEKVDFVSSAGLRVMSYRRILVAERVRRQRLELAI
jgi:anti-anti-sigma regulatory factor